MKSGVKVKIDLKFPTIWTAQDTLKLASNTLASIKLRTSKGIDANGKPFKGYSKKSLYVSKRGARLSPKGGRPSRTGRSVFYQGGYREYKQKSRRRSGSSSAEVDLILSGNMMNNLVVKDATATGFSIGLTKHAQYGYAVDEDRQFLGLTQRDVDILTRSAQAEIARKL